MSMRHSRPPTTPARDTSQNGYGETSSPMSSVPVSALTHEGAAVPSGEVGAVSAGLGMLPAAEVAERWAAAVAARDLPAAREALGEMGWRVSLLEAAAIFEAGDGWGSR